MTIDGKVCVLNSRRFCTACSPFGSHNSSRRPLVDPRTRRLESWVNYSRRRRIRIKLELVAAHGGSCEECGYTNNTGALEFHHRDAASKEFSLGGFLGSLERARREAAKCLLLCANCHRRRHIVVETPSDDAVVRQRRRTKRRAVALLGGRCAGCMAVVPDPLFEFHHLSARTKEFAISHDGIARSWAKTEAELAKCVLLCANCHRETHAGLRTFGDDRVIGEACAEYRVA
jgi:5-methylcytosine-specific restriction endonuclease McrA